MARPPPLPTHARAARGLAQQKGVAWQRAAARLTEAPRPAAHASAYEAKERACDRIARGLEPHRARGACYVCAPHARAGLFLQHEAMSIA
eukprot:gene24205-54126_t